MWGWNFIFGKKDNPLENEEEEVQLPHDFDSFNMLNPMDWFGNYDKSLDDYHNRKADENASKNRITFYIIAGLIGIYLWRR